MYVFLGIIISYFSLNVIISKLLIKHMTCNNKVKLSTVGRRFIYIHYILGLPLAINGYIIYTIKKLVDEVEVCKKKY